jgi:hypothetical protein
MKLILISFFCFFSLNLGLSQEEGKVFIKQSTRIISPKTDDPNEFIFADFVISNMTKKPIIIKEVRPSCHCTVPSYSKEPIKSRGQMTIRLQTTASKLKEVGEVDAIIKLSDPLTKFLKIKIIYAKS